MCLCGSWLNYVIGDLVVLDNEEGCFLDEYCMFMLVFDEELRWFDVNNGVVWYWFIDCLGVYCFKGNCESVVLCGFSVNVDVFMSDFGWVLMEELDECLGWGMY